MDVFGGIWELACPEAHLVALAFLVLVFFILQVTITMKWY